MKQETSPQFDLFRLSASKRAVDVCSNTLRAYNAQGLPFYRMGKAVFVSRSELSEFIRRNGCNERALGSRNKVDRGGYVYIMRSGFRCKIGISEDPAQRLAQCKTADPDIILIGSIYHEDAPKAEKYWHRKFASKHAGREWFKLDHHDIGEILTTGSIPLEVA